MHGIQLWLVVKCRGLRNLMHGACSFWFKIWFIGIPTWNILKYLHLFPRPFWQRSWNQMVILGLPRAFTSCISRQKKSSWNQGLRVLKKLTWLVKYMMDNPLNLVMDFFSTAVAVVAGYVFFLNWKMYPNPSIMNGSLWRQIWLGCLPHLQT